MYLVSNERVFDADFDFVNFSVIEIEQKVI